MDNTNYKVIPLGPPTDRTYETKAMALERCQSQIIVNPRTTYRVYKLVAIVRAAQAPVKIIDLEDCCGSA